MTGSGRKTIGPSPRTARELAVEVLTRVEEKKAYSNLLLNESLNRYPLNRADAALATEIVYGTIQRKNTIDYMLDRFVDKGGRLEPWVRNLLRMSLYQLKYLDRIPPHAVVHESVEIAKTRGHRGIAGMVNAVLRSAIREPERLAIPDGLDPVRRIALEHSHPEWMVAMWLEQFGERETERMCAANNVPPRVSIRVNTLKRSRDELLERMRLGGFDARPSPLAPAGIIVAGGGNMAHTSWYKEGELSIQDESSMLVAESVDPQPGERVLDCCAAPGGKTGHMAEKMGDNGEIVSCDVHEHKRRLIEAQIERLGLKCVTTIVEDARRLPARFDEGTFDRILLDAPCSGLGVIRRKPDVKWAKRPEDIDRIAALQSELLHAVARLLKPGGILVYSTCTVTRQENEDVVNRFLREHADFAPADFPEAVRAVLPEADNGMAVILPHRFGSDGFFIARLRKR